MYKTIEDITDELMEFENKLKEDLISPFIALNAIKYLESVTKDLKEQAKELAMEAASNYPNGKGEQDGVAFITVKGRKIIDYKGVGQWDNAKANVKAIEDLHKAAYEGYQKGNRLVDEDGVFVDIPNVTYVKDHIRIEEV